MILKILGLILFFELYNYRTLFDVRESKCEVGRKGRISTTSIGFSISIPRSNWSRLWTNRVVKFRHGERNNAIKEGLAHIKGEKYIKEYRISGPFLVTDLFRLPSMIIDFLGPVEQICRTSFKSWIFNSTFYKFYSFQ